MAQSRGFEIPQPRPKLAGLSSSRGFELPFFERCIRFEDAGGTPIPNVSSTIELDTLGRTFVSDANGEIKTFIQGGNISSTAPGFEDAVNVIDFSGVADGECLVITLQVKVCVDEEPINRFNLIRWRSIGGELPLDRSIECCEGNKRLPRPFKPVDDKIESLIYVVEGDVLELYINQDTSSTNSDFADLRVGLILDEDYSVVSTFPDLFTRDSINNLKTSITISGLSEGVKYRLLIYNTANNFVRFISDVVQQFTEEKACRYTSLISYRDFCNRNDIEFEAFPDLRISGRIPIYETGNDFESEKEEYREVSTRQKRSNAIQSDKVVNFLAYRMTPEEAGALQKILDHSDVTINGRSYQCKDNLQRSESIGYLTSYTFTMYQLDFSTSDRFG